MGAGQPANTDTADAIYTALDSSRAPPFHFPSKLQSHWKQSNHLINLLVDVGEPVVNHPVTYFATGYVYAFDSAPDKKEKIFLPRP